MDKKNINTIITGVGILLGVGGLYLVGRKIVKKQQEKAKQKRADKLREELENIQGSEDMQKQEEAQAKAYNPNADAEWIRNAIDGVNYNNSDAEQINKTIMSLSDLKLKKIAKHYKAKYNISLYKDLDNEWDNCSKGLLEWYENCYESSMRRLANMGLK